MNLIQKINDYLENKGITATGTFEFVSTDPQFSNGIILTADSDSGKIKEVIDELGAIHLGGKLFFAQPVYYHEGKLPGSSLELVQSYLVRAGNDRVWIAFTARPGYYVEAVKRELMEGIEEALRKGAMEQRRSRKIPSAAS